MADPGELSQALEDYLETIAILQGAGRPARVRDIAARLGLKSPSVTGAVRQLVSRGLAVHERYGGVELTDQGAVLARKVMRRHRVLARFLGQILRVPPEVAEADACRLEHAMSRQTFQALEAFLERIHPEEER